MSNANIPRLYVAHRLTGAERLTLSHEQTHYIKNVMRLKEGDMLRLFNGQDGEWLIKISLVSKQTCNVLPLHLLRPQVNGPDLWLCPAPIKKAHFDYMIEKASELGTSLIEPIITKHTQVRDINIDRLQSIATESSEQSERLTIPLVRKPLTFETTLNNWPEDRTLIICAEFGDATQLKEAFLTFNLKQKTKAGILIGPEGGFTKEELEIARKRPNAHFVRLGPRILRADTAAIAVLSCFQALCGDWTSDTTPVT